MSRRLTRWLRRILAAYLALMVAAALGQRWLIFPRFRGPGGIPVKGESWTVEFDGGTVPVWTVRSPTSPDAPLLVWFHGNAEILSDTWWAQRSFEKRGLSFAAVEYPGYGRATGVGPSEAVILTAARNTMGSLAEQYADIVCVGASLGTGVAAAMAEEGRCRRLVLISPYTSLPAAAQAIYPFLPARWLVLDQLDTASRARSIAVPTLIVHGVKDSTCPVWMGRELAATIPGAQMVEEPRGHADVVDDAVFDTVAAFVWAASSKATMPP